MRKPMTIVTAAMTICEFSNVWELAWRYSPKKISNFLRVVIAGIPSFWSDNSPKLGMSKTKMRGAFCVVHFAQSIVRWSGKKEKRIQMQWLSGVTFVAIWIVVMWCSHSLPWITSKFGEQRRIYLVLMNSVFHFFLAFIFRKHWQNPVSRFPVFRDNSFSRFFRLKFFLSPKVWMGDLITILGVWYFQSSFFHVFLKTDYIAI